MCAILIPALIGVGALAVLGGGGVGGCNSCDSGYSVTIPQEVGQVTNGVPAQMGYAQPAYPQYASVAQQSPMPYAGNVAPGYATQGHYNEGMIQSSNSVGAGVNYDGQSAIGAGAYANPNGAGIGANVGGVDASVGLGNPRAY